VSSKAICPPEGLFNGVRVTVPFVRSALVILLSAVAWARPIKVGTVVLLVPCVLKIGLTIKLDLYLKPGPKDGGKSGAKDGGKYGGKYGGK
jgi:hypothetical protein